MADHAPLLATRVMCPLSRLALRCLLARGVGVDPADGYLVTLAYVQGTVPVAKRESLLRILGGS